MFSRLSSTIFTLPTMKHSVPNKIFAFLAHFPCIGVCHRGLQFLGLLLLKFVYLRNPCIRNLPGELCLLADFYPGISAYVTLNIIFQKKSCVFQKEVRKKFSSFCLIKRFFKKCYLVIRSFRPVIIDYKLLIQHHLLHILQLTLGT